MGKTIDAAEVAKLVRAALHRQFPGTKFSVRTSRYSGGASVDVSWIDGPTSSQVDEVIRPFAGARFDGMTDLKYHASTWVCPEHGARVAETWGHGAGLDDVGDSRCCHLAELASMGADYVHGQRRHSKELRARAVAELEAKTGVPYDPTVRVWDEWYSTLLSRHLHSIDACR